LPKKRGGKSGGRLRRAGRVKRPKKRDGDRKKRSTKGGEGPPLCGKGKKCSRKGGKKHCRRKKETAGRPNEKARRSLSYRKGKPPSLAPKRRHLGKNPVVAKKAHGNGRGGGKKQSHKTSLKKG